jgi:hypothetical protein
MTSNSQEIIHDIRAEFDKMLDFVTGESARLATADQIERGLFKLLIRLGAKLLTLFFVMRSQAGSRETLQTAEGHKLYYQRDTKRDYFSIFGKVAVWRPYFYKTGVGGQNPLDAELSLGDDCYSDLVREVSEYLGVYSVYHKTADILKRLLGLNLSTRVVEENIAEDAAEVEAYYAQKSPPAPADEAEILVIQADGKGVPMILEASAEPKARLGKGEKRGHKKEAVVTTVYTIAAAPRTPQEVVASFFDQPQDTAAAQADSPRPSPQNKHVWATLDGKDAALSRLAKQVAFRQGRHIQHHVALCDGCEALQSRLANHFIDFTQVLDFIHADEYLWDVANSLLGETNEQRTEWMADHALQVLSGQTEQLIADFRHLAQAASTTSSQREQLGKAANYFERNLPYMDYPTYLARGWPIASGVIEGACRHFVKDRCELSGMRWNQDGAENLLHLRAVAENDDWDAYHDFRKRQRHSRLYRSPVPSQTAAEFQALDDVTAARADSTSTPDRQITVSQPANSHHRKNYQELPLAA